MQLNFQCHGDGFPLLILHGLLGSLDNWQNISRKLGETFRVCAVDLRNHGRSPHSDAFNYEVMADDLLEFMGTQQIGRAHLLGHSMGGKAAMHFALRHPEKVEKLVVVDMAPRAYAPTHVPIFDAMLSLDTGSFRERGEIDRALATRIPDAATRQFLLKNLTRNEQGALQWKPNLPAIRKNYDGLNEALDTNGSFKGPALFIKGAKSDYITKNDQALIMSMFPNATISEIHQAGHWVHADAPGEFTELVTNFLS
ncbi:MAG TPA: alpha/beta fold hydrolase [Verrucomicrobiae bacterium]|nr:alpha/beta fold hydrolase [Verrucomicrobiae bacterium]